MVEWWGCISEWILNIVKILSVDRFFTTLENIHKMCAHTSFQRAFYGGKKMPMKSEGINSFQKSIDKSRPNEISISFVNIGSCLAHIYGLVNAREG